MVFKERYTKGENTKVNGFRRRLKMELYGSCGQLLTNGLLDSSVAGSL